MPFGIMKVGLISGISVGSLKFLAIDYSSLIRKKDWLFTNMSNELMF